MGRDGMGWDGRSMCIDAFFCNLIYITMGRGASHLHESGGSHSLLEVRDGRLAKLERSSTSKLEVRWCGAPDGSG
jgi:hypothetical protein